MGGWTGWAGGASFSSRPRTVTSSSMALACRGDKAHDGVAGGPDVLLGDLAVDARTAVVVPSRRSWPRLPAHLSYTFRDNFSGPSESRIRLPRLCSPPGNQRIALTILVCDPIVERPVRSWGEPEGLQIQIADDLGGRIPKSRTRAA